MAGSNGREAGESLGQWRRILWLDGEIRAGRYPNVAGLQREFEVSRRTAFNAITFLRDSLDAPLDYDRRRGGYTYTDPTYALPGVFLEEGELLALFLAERVSREYAGTPLEGALREGIRKLCRYLPERVAVQLADVADLFQFAGGTSAAVPLQLLAETQRAIRERRRMRILYYTASTDTTRERQVEPHFLRIVRGDWMLVAWDDYRNEARVFMLARVREWQVGEERFARRPALDPDVYSEHTFLTEHGSEPYRVALRFDAYQARWIRERVWHASQEVEEQADGGVVLRLTVAGEGDLLRWVLGYGSHVEVLEPAWLRERAAQECRRAAEQYGGSDSCG